MYLINLKVTVNLTFNVCVYIYIYIIYIYIYIYIYTLKKSSTFANLLMENPGNWFTIAKMWEKHLKKEEILRKWAAPLLRLYSGTVFSFCFCKSVFCVSGTSTPNGLNPNN